MSRFVMHSSNIGGLSRKIANREIELPPLKDPEDPALIFDGHSLSVVQVLRRIRSGLPIGVVSLGRPAISGGPKRVLDGDQVVAMVFEICHPTHWSVHYDLIDKKFFKIDIGSGSEIASLPHFLPFQCMFDTMLYLQRVRGFSDSLVEEADKVADAIREYQIPFYIER